MFFVDYFQAFILAVVQGITEWLPVSSSGHLVLARYFMVLEAPVAFDVMLHFGTLTAVLFFLRKQLHALFSGIVDKGSRGSDWNMLFYIFMGSFPAGIAGLVFMEFFESLFSNIYVVGGGLLLSGLMVYMGCRNVGKGSIDSSKSLIVGLIQALSIIPGVSRSGVTIGTGLMLGIRREQAATFSFMTSIPLILGATLLKMNELYSSGIDVGIILAGFVTSAVVGYAALKVMWGMLLGDKFHYFAYYCWALGIILLGLSFYAGY
jgi:undecaprenyl-diphosphatase